jgi:hypothetical protein
MRQARYAVSRSVVTVVAALLVIAGGTRAAEVVLTPRDLAAGFEATKVVVEDAGARLALDPRVFQGGGRHGRIVTDPIDLGPRDGAIGRAGTVTAVAVDVFAITPPGTVIESEVRSGPRQLEESVWSPWHRLGGLRGTVRDMAGRYLQLRATFRATAPDRRPALTGVRLTPTVSAVETWEGTLAVVRQDVRAIVRSPVVFHHERPDQPKLARFRRAARLDQVVSGGRDDFEKLVRLMDWVGSGTNVRDPAWDDKPYPWDIDQVCEINAGGRPVVRGHCMSYVEVFITAATALGYHARHWAVEGFRDMGHEVAEVWVPSLKKWVYFDPSLTSYYFDEATKVPLNVLELHRIVAERFVRPGEDMNWFSRGENNEAVKTRVRELGGQAAVGCRVGPYSYGGPMPPDYDWGWLHGYLATGFIQLTPRNDFHSHPEAASRHFGGAARFVADGYPFWVDDKTPPVRDGTGAVQNWYTRPRDLYWTLDQATLALVKGDEGTLVVEFGQDMPHFRRYHVVVDGSPVTALTDPFPWKLKAGDNRLEVAPVDAYNKTGTPSAVEVRYTIPAATARD